MQPLLQEVQIKLKTFQKEMKSICVKEWKEWQKGLEKKVGLKELLKENWKKNKNTLKRTIRNLVWKSIK